MYLVDIDLPQGVLAIARNVNDLRLACLIYDVAHACAQLCL